MKRLLMKLKPTHIAAWIVLRLVPWESARARLFYLGRRLARSWKYLKGPRSNFLYFRCNVCGMKTSFPRDEFSREGWSCVYCSSNVRWRSVIHALSTELLGKSLAIPDFPVRPELVGVGLSDWDGYAVRLTEKITYTNTYYHREPLLDITSVDPSQYGRYDFVIATDVFEHICPPILKAFENARRLLKPGGVMIFTVPFIEGETKEHFPELYRFSLQKNGNGVILLNETRDGRSQEFSDLTFHGGQGSVLEMRLFGKEGILRNVQDAGFGEIRLYDEEYPEHGILWVPYVAKSAQDRPPFHGMDAPPFALRNCSPNTR